jgi:hypothetical protein
LEEALKFVKLRMVLSLDFEGDIKMFPLSGNFLKFAAAGALAALTITATPASAEEMYQTLGPVAAHDPILTKVGTKRLVAFFVPGNGQCNIQVVIWNADDVEAKSAGGIRVSLNPGQTASLDSSPTEVLTLKCGDDAQTLAAIPSIQQVASK